MGSQTWHDLLEHVRHIRREFGFAAAGSTIVVAVSGGPDSIALLHVLHALSAEYDWTLVCAHMNHGFRPQESAEEAEFVRATATELSITFELEAVDTPLHMVRTGKGAQEAARELRYRFLQRTAAHYRAHTLALAHHMDDQAETVLMRILRGTGLDGLGGMKICRSEKNLELIRPFLRIYKADLVYVCEERGLAYRLDSSNMQRKYTRNRIRLDALPFLEQFNGQLVPTLARLAELASTENDYVQQQTEALYGKLVKEKAGSFSFSAASFCAVHVALQRRLIKLILNYLSSANETFDFNKIEIIRYQIERSELASWNLDVGSGIICVREYDEIRFLEASEPKAEPFCIPVQYANAVISIRDTSIQVEVQTMEWKDRSSDALCFTADEAFFDADVLDFPLYLRSRRPGDAISLLGGGTKKVKNLFIDAKIPLSQRDHIPLLADASGRILWIPGLRRAREALVTAESDRCLYMKIVKSED
ncbi:tRNA lysidine(34) synthetase TilS [Paenibacillus campi]|uniref:tRNA lysidine(34) synthetase TilS n=1 Tax=Paenibacillus campi TaxID=3106031 RepID=UPI002AFF911D|nr:tRNA lysidine(34) synthetase TilS [Paenibacillus sp. SGZ-1014]